MIINMNGFGLFCHIYGVVLSYKDLSYSLKIKKNATRGLKIMMKLMIVYKDLEMNLDV